MTYKSIASASRLVSSVLAALMIVALCAAPAHAKKKRSKKRGAKSAQTNIVLLDFTGPKASSVRKSMVKMLGSKAKLVPVAKYKKAQKRLRARRMSGRDVVKVSKSLDVHGLITGSVKRKRGKYQLSLTLVSGTTGDTVDRLTVTLGRTPRITKRAERDIERKFFPALADLGTHEKDEPRVAKGKRGRDREEVVEDDDDDWETEDTGGDADEVEEEWDDEGDDEEPVRERTARRDDEVPDEIDDEPARDDGDDADAVTVTDKELYGHLGRNRGLDVAAGMSFTQRTLTFTVAEGIMNPPNGYDGGMVPGAYVSAAFYPLAFGKKSVPKNKSPLWGLGVGLVYDKVLKISSKAQGSDIDIPTNQQRYGFSVLYRYNVGSKASGPTVTASVGYNKLQFTLDKEFAAMNGLDIDLPNVEFAYIDPTVALRYPAGDKMALLFSASFLFVMDTGEMQAMNQYGGATVSGLAGDLGLEYRLNTRLLIRGGARIQRIAFDFNGSGALTDRNGDGTADVGGALDQYLGGYATAGYLF